MDWPSQVLSNTTGHPRSRQVPTSLPHQPEHMQDNSYVYDGHISAQYPSYPQPQHLSQCVTDFHSSPALLDFSHQYPSVLNTSPSNNIHGGCDQAVSLVPVHNQCDQTTSLVPLPVDKASMPVTSNTPETLLTLFDLKPLPSNKRPKQILKRQRQSVKTSKDKQTVTKRNPKLPLKFQLQLAADETPSMATSTKHLENQLQCPFCPKKCTWDFQMQQHARTHTGERPFVCTYCNQAFTRLEHMQRHERIHTGERPFKCEECGQRYRRKTQLSRHARAHTNERPYTCHVCEKSFRRKGHLNRHVKLHKPNKTEDSSIDKGDVCEEAPIEPKVEPSDSTDWN